MMFSMMIKKIDIKGSTSHWSTPVRNKFLILTIPNPTVFYPIVMYCHNKNLKNNNVEVYYEYYWNFETCALKFDSNT